MRRHAQSGRASLLSPANAGRPRATWLPSIGRMAQVRRSRQDLFSVAAIRLLAPTGCRESEVLSLTWDAVDVERGHLRLGDTKTGRSIRPLSKAAAAVLEALPRVQENRFVLTGSKPGEHLARHQAPRRQDPPQDSPFAQETPPRRGATARRRACRPQDGARTAPSRASKRKKLRAESSTVSPGSRRDHTGRGVEGQSLAPLAPTAASRSGFVRP